MQRRALRRAQNLIDCRMQGTLSANGMDDPADRSQRLLAAFVDACPLVLVFSVVTYAQRHRSLGLTILAIVLFVGLSFAQFWLLTTRGQTLGKIALGLRIVRTKDGRNGGFVTNVLLRVGAGALIGMIPYLGALYTVTDLLFIFRDDRRCLHDLIAGTRVVKGAPGSAPGSAPASAPNAKPEGAAGKSAWRFRV